ncbi:MAG: CPBP family intramembrane glutamic endopeptidase [Bacillota bacterium]
MFVILIVTRGVVLVTPWHRPVFTPYSLLALAQFALVGWAEELFFRGYCVTALNSGRGTLAAALSALAFVLSHGLNTNISSLALANIFVAGLLFAYMFLGTGSIWMPVGYHITWNYFQGPVFGLPVSGGPVVPGVYEAALKDNLLTGEPSDPREAWWSPPCYRWDSWRCGGI